METMLSALVANGERVVVAGATLIECVAVVRSRTRKGEHFIASGRKGVSVRIGAPECCDALGLLTSGSAGFLIKTLSDTDPHGW